MNINIDFDVIEELKPLYIERLNKAEAQSKETGERMFVVASNPSMKTTATLMYLLAVISGNQIRAIEIKNNGFDIRFAWVEK